MQSVTQRSVTSSVGVIMTATMSWQHSPVSSTTPSGWGSGCRSETGRSLSWSTMTSSTSRRMARRSGWRKGRFSSSSREQTATGGRYVSKTLMPELLHWIHIFYWSRIKSGLAWCQVFKREFLMRGPWFTSAQPCFLQFGASREEQLNCIKLIFSLSPSEQKRNDMARVFVCGSGHWSRDTGQLSAPCHQDTLALRHKLANDDTIMIQCCDQPVMWVWRVDCVSCSVPIAN